MPRLFTALALAASLIVSTSADEKKSEKETESKEAVAHAIKGTPKIDGKIDEAWKDAPVIAVKKSVPKLLAMDADKMATGRVQVMWDENHIYLLWRVKDGKLSTDGLDAWEQDSVELFLDEDLGRTVTYEADDAQYRVNCIGELSGQGTGFDVSRLSADARETKNGYAVEMAVEVNAGKLESGKKLGMELQINDDPGEGARKAVAKWNHTEDDSWSDTSNFGTLILK